MAASDDKPKRDGPGRPPKEIDLGELEKLVRMQCTRAEVAAWFECHEDTIDRRLLADIGINFAAYFEEKRGRGRISLRRRQWKQAIEAGNTTMLIFLGKNYLGQSDKQEIAASGEIAWREVDELPKPGDEDDDD